VILALVLFTGYRSYDREALPLLMSNRYELLGTELLNNRELPSAEKILRIADKEYRFKGMERAKLLQVLLVNRQYNEVLKLFSDSGREGLGPDTIYWKARALQLTGHLPEARAIYVELLQQYPKGTHNHQLAASWVMTIDAAASSPVITGSGLR
jgi:tetratricopeptide (TPR) repeat protein